MVDSISTQRIEDKPSGSSAVGFVKNDQRQSLPFEGTGWFGQLMAVYQSAQKNAAGEAETGVTESFGMRPLAGMDASELADNALSLLQSSGLVEDIPADAREQWSAEDWENALENFFSQLASKDKTLTVSAQAGRTLDHSDNTPLSALETFLKTESAEPPEFAGIAMTGEGVAHSSGNVAKPFESMADTKWANGHALSDRASAFEGGESKVAGAVADLKGTPSEKLTEGLTLRSESIDGDSEVKVVANDIADASLNPLTAVVDGEDVESSSLQNTPAVSGEHSVVADKAASSSVESGKLTHAASEGSDEIVETLSAPPSNSSAKGSEGMSLSSLSAASSSQPVTHAGSGTNSSMNVNSNNLNSSNLAQNGFGGHSHNPQGNSSGQQQTPNQAFQPPLNQVTEATARVAAGREPTAGIVFNDLVEAQSQRSEKSERILGDLGFGLDRKAVLPSGLQAINVPVRAPQWGQAMGHRVVYMASNKIQEAKITLNPENLGPVRVKIQIDKDQQVNVSLTAQHGTTRDSLENALPRLKEMLEDAGIAFGSLDVSTGNPSDAENFAEDESSSQNSFSSQSDQASNDDDASDNTTIIKASDNLVDYYA